MQKFIHAFFVGAQEVQRKIIENCIESFLLLFEKHLPNLGKVVYAEVDYVADNFISILRELNGENGADTHKCTFKWLRPLAAVAPLRM